MDIKQQLYEDFQKVLHRSQWWKAYSGDSFINRLNRFFHKPAHFLSLQISKFRPIPITIEAFWGDKMKCYLPDYFYPQFLGFLWGQPEMNLTQFIIDNFEEDGVFIDVGANVGFFTLLANAISRESGEVHAFEPTPNIFQYLEANTKQHTRTTINQLALSDIVGSEMFYTNPIFSTKNSLVRRKSAPKETQVRAITLDKYCQENSTTPTFIKIDVEGGEHKVIQGSIETLKHSSPIISMEMRRNRNEPHILAANTLINLGYKAYDFDSHGGLKLIPRVDVYTVNKIIPADKVYTNLIFKKMDHNE